MSTIDDTIEIRYKGEAPQSDADGKETPARAPWPKGQYVRIKDYMSGGDIRRINRLALQKIKADGLDADSSDAGIYQGVATCAVMIRSWSGPVIRGSGEIPEYSEETLGDRFDELLDRMPIPTMAIITQEITQLASGPFVTTPNGSASKTESEQP